MPRGPLQTGDPDHIAGYRLDARLGHGGQGIVYLGRDPSGRPVAVKLLHQAMLGDTAARGRFVQELAAVRRVARFCTAQVIEADTDGDRPYIVSEFVDGPSLEAEVARSGPRRGAELDRLAIGTATALVAIHQAGVVHCDFKPANVLLARDGPRVIDFGIARALDVSGTAGEVVGTPAYMAPEQITRSGIGPPVDVFAWAATMAYAVNGVSPFAAGSSVESIYRVLEQPPELGRLAGPLRGLVERCLAKDPAERPGSRELLLGLLSTLGSDKAPREGEEGPTEEIRTERMLGIGATRAATAPGATTAAEPDPARRRSRLVAAAAAAVLLAGGGIVAAVTLLPGAAAETAIPAAFAGRWTGTGRLPAEGTAVNPRIELTAGTRHSEIVVAESACGTGSLDFRSASSTELLMDFRAPGSCPSGVMTFELGADGKLLMHLGEEPGTPYYATLTR